MALADLLWACPACGTEAGIARGKGSVACRACGATYRRLSGAAIEQIRPEGQSVVRAATEWLDTLETRRPMLGPAPPPARASLAEGLPAAPIRMRGELVGWAERFAPPRTGQVRLDAAALVFTADEGSDTALRLDEMTAIQPLSSTLQLKLRDRPVLSLRLLEGSIYDWEVRLQDAVRRRYRDAGRGEIAEFQPRIVCR